MSLVKRITRCLVAQAMVLVAVVCGQVWAKAPFTVQNDIATAIFGDLRDIHISPDNRMVAVFVERGNLATNLMEGELHIYDLSKVRHSLRGDGTIDASLIWSKTISTAKTGPAIDKLRWLPDSSGVVFLAKTPEGNEQLTLADLRNSDIEPLTPPDRDVTAFDVHGRGEFIYSVRDMEFRGAATSPAVARSVAGKWLVDILLGSPKTAVDRSRLWIASNGHHAPVIDATTGDAMIVFKEGQLLLSLSPDGKKAVVALPVASVPAAWAANYQKGQNSPYSSHVAGPQNLAVDISFGLKHSFFLIDLASVRVKQLTLAPTPLSMGWPGNQIVSWSSDGHSLLMTTFPAVNRSAPVSPCLAIVSVDTSAVQCLEPLRSLVDGAGPYSDFLYLHSAEFEGNRDDKIIAHYLGWGRSVTHEFKRTPGGWTAASIETAGSSFSAGDVRLAIKESWSDPPVLIATDTESNKAIVIWDPNPELASVGLDETEIMNWTDKTGKHWEGGLYKPSDYAPGKRYPLVLQTHGFSKNYFSLGGVFPTAFAARELASAGIMVLQLPDNCFGQNPASNEAPCEVRGFDSAIDKLDAERMIDPGKVGIIGFSRTFYYVESALAFGHNKYAAASMADGVSGGYFQYMGSVDSTLYNSFAVDAERMNGGSPFERGMKAWLKNSPDFNLDKVTTPIIIGALGKRSLLTDWGTYATLRYLKKAVDLNLFDSDEHVLTNPAVRLASQGGTVDWFRFWLQGYEDPAPDKAQQYRRWEGLCDMQIAEKTGQPTFCVPTKH